MKHSLWRLISSFYILLISGLMVIISAYAWMVISKAPSVSGSNIAVDIPKVFYDTVTVSEETLNNIPLKADDAGKYTVKSAEEFVAVMRAIDRGDITGNIEICLQTHISLEPTSIWRASAEDKGLESVDVESSSKIEKIKIYADTERLKTPTVFIKGLTDALFSGGASTASIELCDITLMEAEIKGENTEAVGAFVSDATMPVLIRNCRLLDSSVSGGKVGGMIGTANTNAEVLVKGCTVSGSTIAGSSVGEIIGTIEGGTTAIADPVCEGNRLLQNGEAVSVNTPYGSFTADGNHGILNLVNTELATVEAYCGFAQVAADCFNSDTFNQLWTVYGTLQLTDEIRFQGNHVDIVGKNNAVIELSGTSGFNFGLLGENSITTKFQDSSSVKFTDITLKNTKNAEDFEFSSAAYYIYVNARNTVYNNCVFEGGVAVPHTAYFSDCKITETNPEKYCLWFFTPNTVIDSNAICVISDSCEITANEGTAGCVLIDGKKQILAVYNSEFTNQSANPAVYVNDEMNIITDGNNLFTSKAGGILAENENSCTFNDSEFYCPTKEQYQNADVLAKAQLDRTEHGNNASKDFDADIIYDGVMQEEIPGDVSNIQKDETGAYLIYTAEEFIAVMNMLNQKDESGASTLEGNYRIILKTHINLSGYDWNSVSINDVNKKLQTITIEADTEALGTSTAFIQGFNAPWFGVLQSKSTQTKIVFEDITVIHSDMKLSTADYPNSGAFVSDCKIAAELTNCHLMNSSIISEKNESDEYSRIGGIIGYTNASEVRISDCSVRECTFEGASVGSIVGHASASQSNETHIVDCFAEGNTLTCLEDATWRVGEFVGTANQGGITIVNPMVLENHLIQETATDGVSKAQGSSNNGDPNYFLYGRFSAANRGKLIFVDNKTNPELHTAVVYGGFDPNAAQFLTSESQVWLIYDSARVSEEMRFTGNDITVKSYAEGKTATILLNSTVKTNGFGMGQAKTPSGFNFGAYTKKTSFKPNSKIYFENLKIQNKKSCTIKYYDRQSVHLRFCTRRILYKLYV
ncbi:MAG: hypothetical protein IJA86_06310 [Clostridia bacterium]|nr:hypothetical protein [Clostridia bacterium]